MESPRERALEMLTGIVTGDKHDLDRRMQAAEMVLRNTSADIREQISPHARPEQEEQAVPTN